MKYAIILPDGAADEPLAELNGRTPLQAAAIPNMDWIAGSGCCGTAVHVAPEFLPGSDVATLSVLGYDPRRYYTGRAPLEAAARQLDVGPGDVVFRCNLVTIEGGMMADFSAGHIDQQHAEAIIDTLNCELGNDRVRFHPGVMYRHLMVCKDGAGLDVRCTPPHDIPHQPVADHLPQGRDAAFIRGIMEQAGPLLESHPVNAERRRTGQRPATAIWLWGHGPMPQLPSFKSLHGIDGACIAAVDLIRGIAQLCGWPMIEVPGATGYLDTNYANKGRWAADALDTYDLVAVHIEAPDEAGHNGDAAGKVQALERIDELVVGPVLDRLRVSDAWRILIAPDHPTPVARRTHTRTPPPFCMAGAGIDPCGHPGFSEHNAEAHGPRVDPGWMLMGHFARPAPVRLTPQQ